MATVGIAFNASSELVAFVLGVDGALWYASQSAVGSSTWSAWTTLGGGPATQLTVAANADQTLAVFALVGGTAQWITQDSSQSSGWSSWAGLGSPTLSRINIATNSDGILELFGIGADGALWHSWQTAVNSSTWSAWASLGAGVTGTPGLVDVAVVQTSGVSGSGILVAFALDAAGAVQTIRQSGAGWGAWSSLGSPTGATLGRITAALNQDGRMEVFAIDGTGAVWHLYQESGPLHPWSPWATLGGSAIVALSIALNTNGALEAFGVTNGVMVHTYQTSAGGNGWTYWASLGNPDTVALTQTIATPVADSSGHLTVFGLGTAPTVALATARIAQTGTTNAWSAWTTMGSIVAPMIDHVVVLMLENRGFDSVLGYLYPQDAELNVVPAGGPGFAGLIGFDAPEQVAWRDGRFGRTRLTARPRPSVDGPNSPGVGPGEEFESTNVQLFGHADPPVGATPTMTGFLQSFCDHVDGAFPDRACERILDCFTPADVPVLSALARTYAVSDAWFSSVPTQTNANRAFSICGTSLGEVDNGEFPVNLSTRLFDADAFDAPTVWNALAAAGVSWQVYYNEMYPPISVPTRHPYSWWSFPQMTALPDASARFSKIGTFFQDAAAGALPAFTYIEPSWAGEPHGFYFDGNDYHPPVDIGHSEAMLRQIYEALRSNDAAWQRTLLVIVFDEHGGTYDHVPPPAATPPWGASTAPPVTRQFGFNFDRFGVRVPCLLVSPWIDAHTVVRSNTGVPFDHTSIPASLLDWRGIDRSSVLGQRVAAAPSFWHVFTRTTPRVDDHAFPPPSGPAEGTVVQFGQPFLLSCAEDALLGVPDLNAARLFALLADVGVAHEFRGGYGPVLSGARVQLRNMLPALVSRTLGRRPPNVLGAWNATDALSYNNSNVNKDPRPQQFHVRALNRTPGAALAYGDQVHFTATIDSADGYCVEAEGSQLVLKPQNQATTVWTIKPMPTPPGS